MADNAVRTTQPGCNPEATGQKKDAPKDPYGWQASVPSRFVPAQVVGDKAKKNWRKRACEAILLLWWFCRSRLPAMP
eukprot:gene10819-4985_t